MGHSLDQEKGRCSFFLEFSLFHLLPHWFPPLGSGIRGERTGENNYFDSAGFFFFFKCSLGSKMDSSSLEACVVLWRHRRGIAALYRYLTLAMSPPQHLPAESTMTQDLGWGPFTVRYLPGA